MNVDFMKYPDISLYVNGDKIEDLLKVEYTDESVIVHALVRRLDAIVYEDSTGDRFDIEIKDEGITIFSESQWYLNNTKIVVQRNKGAHIYLTFNKRQD